VNQGQWKLRIILIMFMMAISLSMPNPACTQTPEEQRKKREQQQEQQKQQQEHKLQQEQQRRQQQEQQHQRLQQERLRKQQEQQKQQQQKPQPDQLKNQQEQQRRSTGPATGGPAHGTQAQTGQPPAQKQPSQPATQTGRSGTPGGQQSGQNLQRPADQHKAGSTQGQPVTKAGQPGTSGGQQSGQNLQRPAGQPGAGPTRSQPDAKAAQPKQEPHQPTMSARQRTTVTIKQPPQERQHVLTERYKEIRPEHNARAAVRFQSERARFKPVSRVVVHHSPEIHRRVFENHHFHPETYHARRAAFYEAYRFRTPVWAFGLQPRYGLWDTPALAFILTHAADEQYALWYHSHHLDPDVIAWRQEMNRLAAANAELTYQLAVMDAKAQELQARGVQADYSYVPPEMEDIALAVEVAVPTQGQNHQEWPPAQPQQYQQYPQPRQYQQPVPQAPPVAYRKAADIGFMLSAAERKGDVVTLTVRLSNTATDGRSVALYDDSYSWPKSHLIDASGHSYEVREVYFRKGAERISIYDTGKTGISIDGGATVTAHLVFKQISDGSRRATLNLHPFIYHGRSWTEHDVDFPDIILQ
jgi:hypothetical protein